MRVEEITQALSGTIRQRDDADDAQKSIPDIDPGAVRQRQAQSLAAIGFGLQGNDGEVVGLGIEQQRSTQAAAPG